jgi:chromatin segregation and condensation protein Rec8/ScpA/Scc1 (kleisin family)
VIAPAEAIPRTVTLAERAALIRAAIAEAGPVVLQDLLAGVRDRVVVAVTFLAMLELVKGREVTVEQERPWGPIIVRPVPRPVGGGTPDDDPQEDA